MTGRSFLDFLGLPGPRRLAGHLLEAQAGRPAVPSDAGHRRSFALRRGVILLCGTVNRPSLDVLAATGPRIRSKSACDPLRVEVLAGGPTADGACCSISTTTTKQRLK